MPPAQIGPYTIEDELGRGGMAIVYRAVDSRNARTVALKVLPQEFVHNDVLLHRFQREGRSTQALSHRNIVRVFELDTADGYYYIAMEIATQGTLSDLMKRHDGPLPDQEALAILQQVAAGLDHAHSQGFLHRDIKPSNVLFTEDGRAIIADFGVAKDLNNQDFAITRPGTSVGTPAFMSPEQARGDQPVDHRSDIYSLGVVAYYMFTGKMPFEAESEFSLLRKIVDDPPPPPEQYKPNMQAGVAYILRLVLDKNPDNRYHTAGAFVSKLAANLTLSSKSQSSRSQGINAPASSAPKTPSQPKTPPTPKTPSQPKTPSTPKTAPNPKTPPRENTPPTPKTPPSSVSQSPSSQENRAAPPTPKQTLSASPVNTALPPVTDPRPPRRNARVLTSIVLFPVVAALIWVLWSFAGRPPAQPGGPSAPETDVAAATTSPTPTATATLPTPDATAPATDAPNPGGGIVLPGNTQTPSPTLTPSSTSTPSTTPRPSSTPTATATPTATPSATPTIVTRRPTSTPAFLGSSPTASPTSQTTATVLRFIPTQTPTMYTFSLVRPDNAVLINYAKEIFEWHTTYPLRSTQALELVFWPKVLGPDAWTQGRSPIGAKSRGTDDTVWRWEINLIGFEAAQPDFFKPGDFYWGVLLVNQSPYRRIALLNGEYRIFTYAH